MARTTHRIGPGTAVSGSIEGAGDLVVAGAIAGGLRVDGSIRIESGGSVRVADGSAVQVASIDIYGELVGIAQVSEHARVRTGAMLDGALVAPRLVIEAGARVRGWIETTDGWHAPEPEHVQPAAAEVAPVAPTAPATETPAATDASETNDGASSVDIADTNAPEAQSPQPAQEALAAEADADATVDGAGADETPDNEPDAAPSSSEPPAVADRAPAPARPAAKGKRR